MKYKTLREAYTGIYKPKPKVSDYFPHKDRLIILERKGDEDIQQKSIALYNDFASASDGLLRTDQKPSSNTLAYFKRKGARLALTNLGKQQTPESYNFDFVKQIANTIQATVDDIFGIPPTKQQKLLKTTGKQISLSSKFNTYYITRNNVTIPIVICVTYNKGLALEEELYTDFKKQLTGELQAGGLLEALLRKFHLENRHQEVEIKFDPGKSEKRTIGLEEDQITNVGKAIADFTLFDTKTSKEFFISLKGVDGITIANKGASGVFKETSTTDAETNQQSITVTVGNNTSLDVFFSSITGNKDEIKDRICKGLEEYASGTLEASKEAKTTDQYYFENIAITSALKRIIHNSIKSGLGYGYYYLKEKKKTEYIFIDLTTKDKLNSFVEQNIQIENVSIQFPYYTGSGRGQSSKAFNLYVSTKNGSVYTINMRTKNANKFVPSEFLIAVNKFEANPENKKDMILTIIPPAAVASKIVKNK